MLLAVRASRLRLLLELSSFCFELASALRADALPLLEVVELDDNPIGDDGCAALAGVVFSGHEASSLRVISMLGTRVSQQGRAALREALESNQSRRRAAAQSVNWRRRRGVAQAYKSCST